MKGDTKQFKNYFYGQSSFNYYGPWGKSVFWKKI